MKKLLFSFFLLLSSSFVYAGQAPIEMSLSEAITWIVVLVLSILAIVKFFQISSDIRKIREKIVDEADAEK